jgi:hypothetical protein
VWSRHAGDPILKSNITRRVDFAQFKVEALTDDNLVHEAPANRRPPHTLRARTLRARPRRRNPRRIGISPARPNGVPMTPLRKTALVAGTLYLLTFVSIPTLALYGPVREPNYIAGPGPDTGVIWGGVLEMIVALACIGTAVVLYPVLKQHNEGLALGFVGIRVLEAATIIAGIVSLMSVVTLRQAGAGTEALVTGQALIALRDWTFLLGQGFLPAVNALLLGTLLYQSRLVPRILPLLGLIGAPLLVTSAAATMFGLWDQVSPASALLTIPIALWEFSLGVYLIVKGFKPSPITTGMAATSTTAPT